MKKIISILMTVTMSASLFTGCGSDKSFNASKDITIVSREDGSGTRGAFVELFGIEEKDENGDKIDRTTTEAMITNNTSVMMTTVSGNMYSIGYISLGSLNDTVKAVKIDGAEVSVENVKNNSYKIARPFNIATKDNVSEVTQDFINYIMSSDGQQIITDNGYIGSDDAAPYSGNTPSGKIVIAGSSSVSPVMEKLIEAYEAVNPNANIQLQESDSTTGMNDAIEDRSDIGMASRDLKDSELESGLTGITIATDGIAVIVNNENPVEGLTSEQIKQIFTGEVTTWESFVS